MTGEGAHNDTMNKIKKIAPWLIAVAVFIWLFRKYPPAQIYNSLKLMNVAFFCASAVIYFLAMYVVDTWAIARVLRRFGHESSVMELLPARGATYLVMIINYAASQAAFAYYQYRKHGLPLREMMGIFGIIVVTDLYLLLLLAFVSSFFTTWPFAIAGVPIGTFLKWLAGAAFLLFILNLAFWRSRLNIPIVSKIRDSSFFSVLKNASALDYISVALHRLPVHGFIMLGMYIVIVNTFHIHLPFIKILANIPIIFFIGAIPLTPSGIGTSNLALVELLKPYIESPSITQGIVSAGDLLFAFSLMWMFANYLLKALTGIVCLKLASKDLFKPIEGKEKTAIPDVTHLADSL